MFVSGANAIALRHDLCGECATCQRIFPSSRTIAKVSEAAGSREWAREPTPANDDARAALILSSHPDVGGNPEPIVSSEEVT